MFPDVISPREEEVVFAELLRTFAIDGHHLAEGFEGRLNSLIEAEPINVETGNLQAGMPSDYIADWLVPFTQAILHRSKLCELSLPVREITECL